jgi:hypothetical protein
MAVTLGAGAALFIKPTTSVAAAFGINFGFGALGGAVSSIVGQRVNYYFDNNRSGGFWESLDWAMVGTAAVAGALFNGFGNHFGCNIVYRRKCVF